MEIHQFSISKYGARFFQFVDAIKHQPFEDSEKIPVGKTSVPHPIFDDGGRRLPF